MKERESDILTRGSITTLDPTYLTSPSDLTDIDLSILALRPDLPILTRQRCYALFSTRKLVYDSLEKDCKPPETSLSLVQWDLASYSSLGALNLSSLLPSELLLLQFHPSLTPTLHTQLSDIFFKKSDNERYRSRLRSPLSVEGMKVAEFSLKEHDKMIIRKRERQRIRLEMSAESLRLVDVGGEVEGNVEEEACEILESDMTKVIYLAGALYPPQNPSQNQAQQCTLRIFIKSYYLHGKKCDLEDGGVVEVDLGPLETNDTKFVALRLAFRGWRQKWAFEIGAEEVSPATNSTPSHSLSSIQPTRPRSRSLSPRLSKKRERSLSPLPGFKPSSSHHEENRRASYPRERERDSYHSQERERSLVPTDVGRFKSGGIDYSPVWKFVGNHPMNLDWNPGYYTRQAALVRAINPSAEIPLPIFSLEEVALLSRKSDPARLPDLRKAVGAGKGVRYPVEERLGLEKIYRDKQYVDVEIVGSIMSSPSMSDLATYVRMMAKMITCRDILKKEWLNLLDYLEKRKRNSTTRDPVESLWELVNGLAGSESRRIEVFTENGSLITENNGLSQEQIGVGPWRRFKDSLIFVTDFEQDAYAVFHVPEGMGLVNLGATKRKFK